MASQQLTVEEMLQGLPKNEQLIVKRLRNIVLECLPKAEEKVYYGWGVPFYRRHRLICFIWPPSLFLEKECTSEKLMAKGVSLGFCQGNRMANEDGALLAEGRKQVYCLYFHFLKDINEEQVRALLFEADLVDQGFAPARKKK